MATSSSGVISLRTEIDRTGPIPYYVQLKDALREQIERGNWQPGNTLPGEPELCRMFNVSRTVVRQALKEMTYEGLVVRQKGKGTFVAAPKIGESLVQKLTGFYQDMLERGLEPATHVLKQEVVQANPKVAANLRLEPGTSVIQIDRLRFVQDEPIVFVTTYLPKSLCPNLLTVDLSQRSLYQFLEEECGLQLASGRRLIEAVAASNSEAKLLRVKRGTPLILLESVTYLGDGTPIEYYHALHRGDRSRFEVALVRVRQQGKTVETIGTGGLELPPGSGLTSNERKLSP